MILSRLPDELFVCRELTKKFQEVIRITKDNYLEKIERIKAKGEFVFVLNYLGSNDHVNNYSEEIHELADQIVNGNCKPRVLAKLLGKLTGRPVKDVYLSLEKNLKKFKEMTIVVCEKTIK